MREDDIQALKRQLDHLDRRMEELEGRLAQAGSALRERYQGELKALRNRHREAEAEMARLRVDEAESWEREDLQGGLLAIFDDIGGRLDRLFGQFNREDEPD